MPAHPVTAAVDTLKLRISSIEPLVRIALDRVTRHGLAEEPFDLRPNLLDAQVFLSFRQNLDNGAADGAEFASSIRPRPGGFWRSFRRFTQWLTCETLE
jgi:hypothetical protein